MRPASGRQAWLDWLRIGAVVSVVFYHAAMPFAAGETWHIRNAEESKLLLEFNFWSSRFRMPLLFFVSGAVTFHLLSRKSVGEFIRLRFVRLMVPLLFGMLVIVPPQVYMERLAAGKATSFLTFYPSVFDFVPYPEGNTSWHHLWFILYLFAYDLAGAPVLRWMLGRLAAGGLRWVDWCSRGARVYLLGLPQVVAFATLILAYPSRQDFIHDPAMHVVYASSLVAGFLVAAHAPLLASVVRHRRTSLTLAVATMAFVNYARWNDLAPWTVAAPGWREAWSTKAYLAIMATTAWCWVLAIVGYGKRYLDHRHAALEYLNPAVYPVYILHQTVIVILAYYVVRSTDSVVAKYLFLVSWSFALTILAYHLVVRPSRWLRPLFGMAGDGPGNWRSASPRDTITRGAVVDTTG